MKTPTYFILLSAILILFLGDWKQRFRVLKGYYSFWAALAFLILINIGLIISIKMGNFGFLYHRYSTYFLWLIVFMSTLSVSWPREWKDRIMGTFILGAVIASIILAIDTHYQLPTYQSIAISDHSFLHKLLFGSQVRIGISYNPIPTSLVIACASFLALISFKKIRNSIYFFWRYLVAVMILCGFLLFFNSERTGVIAFFLILFSYVALFFSGKSRLILISVTIGFAGLIYFISPTVKARMNLGVAQIENYAYDRDSFTENTSMGIRISSVIKSIPLLKERPILGFGTGSFQTVYMRINQNTLVCHEEIEYLSDAVDWGIVGLLIYLLFLMALIRDAIRLHCEEYREIIVIVIAYFLVSFFSMPLYSWNSSLFFAAFMGVMLSKTSKN